MTVAADLDLTTAVTPRGKWRDVAIGVEAHPALKAWLRGGVHWNAAGPVADRGGAVASVGGSYAVYGAVQADGQVSFGSASGDRGGVSGCGSSFRATKSFNELYFLDKKCQ